MIARTLISLTIALSLVNCATSFTGSAYFEGGRSACESKCAEQGLSMTGMVYMGEYSSACVCEKPNQGGSTTSAAGISGSAVGVILQQRASQQQAHPHHY